MPNPLILYDGYCILCNAIVQFIQPRQSEKALDYASLQSAKGQSVLEKCGLSTTRLDTFVLVEGGRCYVRSTGVLRLARHLRFPWKLLYALLLVPPAIRNPVYNWIARNRTDWFGQLPHE